MTHRVTSTVFAGDRDAAERTCRRAGRIEDYEGRGRPPRGSGARCLAWDGPRGLRMQ